MDLRPDWCEETAAGSGCSESFLTALKSSESSAITLTPPWTGAGWGFKRAYHEWLGEAL